MKNLLHATGPIILVICDYNCSDIAEHDEQQCVEYTFGGISAAAALECDHSIVDFTDPTEWDTAITAGEATIFSRIKGEIPDGSDVESESLIGCKDTDLDGHDQVFNFKDGQVSDTNDTWAASLTGRTTYLVVYLCDSDEILITPTTGQWSVRAAMVPGSRKEKQMYNGSFKWFQKTGTSVTRVAAPTGIFN